MLGRVIPKKENKNTRGSDSSSGKVNVYIRLVINHLLSLILYIIMKYLGYLFKYKKIIFYY